MSALRMISVAAATGLLLSTAATGSAQTAEFSAAIGLAAPIGDLGNSYARQYGYSYKVSRSFEGRIFIHPNDSRIGVRADGGFVRFHSTTEGEVGGGSFQDLVWLMGNVVYRFRSSGSIAPYLLAGGGMLGDLGMVEVRNSRFGLQGGAGANFGTGTLGGFVEARYVTGSAGGATTSFVPLLVGLSLRTR